MPEFKLTEEQKEWFGERLKESPTDCFVIPTNFTKREKCYEILH